MLPGGYGQAGILVEFYHVLVDGQVTGIPCTTQCDARIRQAHGPRGLCLIPWLTPWSVLLW